MGNSLRCCLACVLPCEAFDLIHIVHLNGSVEELPGPVTTSEFLSDNPNHVLSKLSSQGVNNVRRILISSPDSELKKGSIYFLIPSSSLPENKKLLAGKRHRKASKVYGYDGVLSECEIYLKGISPEKKGSRRDRRTGRSGVWQPQLESISED